MSNDGERPTVDERRGSRPRSEPSPAAPESPDARYQLGAEIARGGMGRVVEATDTVLGRTVALKAALSTDPEAIRRFRRETNITARLEHPSIVPVHDAGTHADGSPFYVMRRVGGRPLDRVVAETDTLAQRLALIPILVSAAQALAHAHRRGVIHRDIKPANILIGDLGETIVIDWGLAKVIDEPDEDDPHAAPPLDAGASLRTRIGTVFGTPGFMSPEQLRGEPVDARSDVYALGATLYFMLARVPPHSSESEDDMMAAAAAGPPTPIGARVAGVPPELSTIVDKSLAFDEGVRYADAAALAEDLGRFLAGQLVASHHYSPVERVRRLVRRHRISFAIAAIAFIAFIAGGWLAIHRIVAERDRANEQTELATTRAHDAELAKQREQDRADQLVLTQARTLATTNPTGAIAALKQLRTPNERWQKVWLNARDIAAGAREAGVAWSLAGPTMPLSLEIAPNGTRAVVSGSDGSIRILELVERRERTIATVDPESNARFISDDLVAVYRNTSLALFDLRDGSRASVTMAADVLHTASTSTVLFWTDIDHALWRLDVHDHTPERIPISELGALVALEVSPDEHWLAVSGDRGAILIDVAAKTSRLLARGDTTGLLAWSHDSRSVAIAFATHVDIVPIAGGTTRVYPCPPYATTIQLGSYNRLFVSTTAGLMVNQGAQLVPFTETPHVVGGLGLLPGNADRVVYEIDDAIAVVGDARIALLHPPIEGFLRLAVSRNSRFVLAAASGRLLVWNLEEMMPPANTIDDVNQYALLGKRQVIACHGIVWTSTDLETGKGAPIDGLPILPFARIIGGTDQAALLIGGQGDNAYVIRKGAVAELAAQDVRYGELTAHEAVLALSRGPIVSYDLATKQTTTLIEHGEQVVTTAWNDGWFVAAFTDGTLWRRDRKTGAESTVQLAVAKPYGQNVVIDATGNVFAPAGNEIMRWRVDGHLVDHATVTGPIQAFTLAGTSIVAFTEEHAGYTVALDRPDQVAGRIPPGTRYFARGEDSDLIATEGAVGNAILLDLLTGERWPLIPPSRNRPLNGVQMSSDGRRVSGLVGSTLWIWPVSLPATAAETAAWLDQMTNATSELGTSTLTWQPQTPP